MRLGRIDLALEAQLRKMAAEPGCTAGDLEDTEQGAQSRIDWQVVHTEHCYRVHFAVVHIGDIVGEQGIAGHCQMMDFAVDPIEAGLEVVLVEGLVDSYLEEHYRKER